MILCTNCWNGKNDCSCEKSERYLVQMDENIEDIIITLNRKNYRTNFCCGGHANIRVLQVYIVFQNEYDFKVYPQGFTSVSGRKIEFLIDNTSHLNIEERQAIIDEKIDELKRWVELL